jgi:hypothetical protein
MEIAIHRLVGELLRPTGEVLTMAKVLKCDDVVVLLSLVRGAVADRVELNY